MDGNIPPGAGNHHHLLYGRTFLTGAEVSTGLADAKPQIIENKSQSGVSDFFYPAEDRAL